MPPPKTRLDRLVTLRERGEDSALEKLARARSSVGDAAARLTDLRDEARADGRSRDAAELWVCAELAQVRLCEEVRTAEGELAQARQAEHAAKAGYTAAHRKAEAARRVQAKRREQIVAEREARDQKALDELATARFNAKR